MESQKLPRSVAKNSLFANPGSRKVYKRLLPTLDALGISTALIEAVSVYCNASAQYDECAEAVSREGTSLLSDKGSQYINPNLTASKLAWNKMLTAGRVLGLTAEKLAEVSADAAKSEKTSLISFTSKRTGKSKTA